MRGDRAVALSRLASGALLAFFLGISSDGIAADEESGFATRFLILERSDYQEGCFDPCMCPIMLQNDFSGDFHLKPAGTDGSFALYEITRVDWVLSGLGRHITGSGSFRINGDSPPLQRLELDLQANDGPVEHFDSGLVPTETPFPRIDAQVSMNQMWCYDKVFTIQAAPAGPPTVDLTTGESMLEWTSLPGATAYDVVCGDLTLLRGTGGDFSLATQECLANDLPATSLYYSMELGVGTATWFLVRAWGEGFSATYDSPDPSQVATRDLGIFESHLACP